MDPLRIYTTLCLLHYSLSSLKLLFLSDSVFQTFSQFLFPFLPSSDLIFCICLHIFISRHPSHRPISLLAQQQIGFITFLMLFVIAWHSQHVKSKSFFQGVHLRGMRGSQSALCECCTNQGFLSSLSVSISYCLTQRTLNIQRWIIA